MLKTELLKIPMQLVQYVNAQKLFKALGVYLMLKASCDGYLVLTKGLRSQIMEQLGIHTMSSFSKYINQLKELNWIGVDDATHTYYVRGFNTIRRQHGWLNSTSVVFPVAKDARQMKVFVQASCVGYKVRTMVNGRAAKARRLLGNSSALKKESALQELVANKEISAYVGLSISKLAELLGVSMSQADRIKPQLKDAGYIRCRKKYNVVLISDKPDMSLYSHLPANKRYSVNITSKAGIKYYEYRERSYDEIINCMEFVNQRTIVRRIKYEKSSLGKGADNFYAIAVL